MKLKKLTKKKVGLLVLLIGLILFLLIVNNAFNGNPISKRLAKNKIQNYINTTYPETDFKISDVFYNFKDMTYICNITSKSKGLNFSITEYNTGYFYDQYAESNNGKYLIDSDLTSSFKNTLQEEFNSIIDNSNLETFVDILAFQLDHKDKTIKYDKSFSEPFIISVTDNIDIHNNEKLYDLDDMVSALIKLKQHISKNNYVGFKALYFNYFEKDDSVKSILITPDKLDYPDNEIKNLISDNYVSAYINPQTGDITLETLDENDEKEKESEISKN
ncbi:MAG: hypothetical protein ACRDCW_16845 [Sarcina sp.]